MSLMLWNVTDNVKCCIYCQDQDSCRSFMLNNKYLHDCMCNMRHVR